MFPTISEIHFSVYGGTSTYCRRAEYEENSTPVPEGYLQFLYASSLFLFALSTGKFRWMLKNILMRICLLPGFFCGC